MDGAAGMVNADDWPVDRYVEQIRKGLAPAT
jgi:hypothetical protein